MQLDRMLSKAWSLIFGSLLLGACQGAPMFGSKTDDSLDKPTELSNETRFGAQHDANLNLHGKPTAPINATLSSEQSLVAGTVAPVTLKLTVGVPLESLELNISARSGALLAGGPVIQSLSKIEPAKPTLLNLTLIPNGEGPAILLMRASARIGGAIQSRTQLLSLDVQGALPRARLDQNDIQQLPDGSAYISLPAEQIE